MMFKLELFKDHYSYLLQVHYRWMMQKPINSVNVSRYYLMDKVDYMSIMIYSD